MYQTQARLFALELIAVERGIFPDTYLVSRPGEQAKFVTGPHDGRSGLVNIISGGTLQEAGMNSNLTANNLIDRIERSMRITSGTPAEYGGESVTNVRTGKRGDAILSAVVDFPSQEAQEVLAARFRPRFFVARPRRSAELYFSAVRLRTHRLHCHIHHLS